MSQSISHFWEKYITILKSYGVKAPALRWYVRYAEEYIKAHQTVRLGGFDKGHGQITIAIFRVSLALGFAITDFVCEK